jgi:hypothetical protein
MEEQARSHYERFKKAAASGERKAISEDFKRFFARLSDEGKQGVRPLLDEILRDSEALTTEGDALAERIEGMLAEDRRLKRPMHQT